MHHQGSHRLILASVPLFLSSIRAQVVLVTTLCLIGSPVLAVTKSTKLKYAETRRVDQTDEYFGVKVPDPYRWLGADLHSSHEVAGCPPFLFMPETQSEFYNP
jgi:hypothetical protein